MAASPTPSTEFAKGLAGVIAGQTAICSLDGTLRYRGYAIEPLAETGDFEEVAWLLLHGELPTLAEHTAFSTRLAAAARSLDGRVLDALARLAEASPQASVMDALRTGISMLGLMERGRHARGPQRPDRAGGAATRPEAGDPRRLDRPHGWSQPAALARWPHRQGPAPAAHRPRTVAGPHRPLRHHARALCRA